MLSDLAEQRDRFDFVGSTSLVVGMNYRIHLRTNYHQAIRHPNLQPASSPPKARKSAQNGTLDLLLLSIKVSP